MLKAFPKILIAFFLTVFILQLGLLLFLTLAPRAGQAADIEFTPQVIQDLGYTFDASDKTTGNIANLVKAIYKYAIGIVGILAAVVLMIGGVIWIMAGGSATAIGEAKAWIGASLTGLTLALLSYLILATINPALVNFQISGVEKVKENKKISTVGCCENTIGGCGMVYGENNCYGGWYEGANYSCSKDGKCVLPSSYGETLNREGQIDCRNKFNGTCRRGCGEGEIYRGWCDQQFQCCSIDNSIKFCKDYGENYSCVSVDSCIGDDREKFNYPCLTSSSYSKEECCKIKNTGTTNNDQTAAPANDYCIIKGSDCTYNGKGGYCDGTGYCLTANASGGEWCGKKDNFGYCTTPSYLMCPSGKSRVWTGRSCVSSYYCCK